MKRQAALLGTLALCLGWLVVFKNNDYDTWWHLRTGQWIVQHLSIPRTDIFSWTIPGQPWTSFEWLSQVLFYGLYAAGGAAALTGLKVFLVAALCALVVVYAGVSESELVVAVPAAVLALCGARSGLVERPQLFTFLLTALYLVLLKRGEKDSRFLWALPGLQILWANLHGGASVVGLILIGCWLAASRERVLLGKVFAACFAASLLNPFGVRIYTHLLETVNFQFREVISEWAPLRFDAATRPVWLPLLALEALSLAAWLRNPARRRAEALVWLAFFILPFRAIRFLVNSLFVFAQLLAGNAPAGAGRPAKTVAAVAFCFAAAWAGDTFGYAGTFERGVGAAHAPVDVVAYLDRAGVKGKMFNSYELGGQLIWLAPGRPVFIDGRNVEYGPELVRKAMTWFRPDVWGPLEREFGFDYAVIQSSPYYLCAILDADPDWRLTYWDDEALVYVRVGGENSALAKGGYRLIRPNEINYAFDETIGKGQGAALLAEVTRSVDAAPRHVNPRMMKSFLLRRLGKPEEAAAEAAEARRLAPGRVEPVFAEAMALQTAGKLDEAAARYDDVMRLVGRFGDPALRLQALNNMGVVAYRRGDKKGAAVLWRQALKLDPENPGIRNNLSRAEGS